MKTEEKMNRRNYISFLAVLMIILLTGCSIHSDHNNPWLENTYTWDFHDVKDIFDPMEYVAKGYFEMTRDEILELNQEMEINAYFVDDRLTTLNRSWSMGPEGMKCTEELRFENEELQSITYSYYYYTGYEEEARDFFLVLCDRIKQITYEPRWTGSREWLGVGQSNYEEISIEEVEKYLHDENIDMGYAVDMENKFYSELDKERGYEPFDPKSIREDARWVAGMKNATIVIVYRHWGSYPTPIEVSLYVGR